MSIAKTAELFRVGTATLKRLRRLKRETGSLEPRPRKNGPASKRTPERLEMLRLLVEDGPDRFGHELAELWTAAAGVRMTRSDVVRGLADLGVSRKKSPSKPVRGTLLGSASSARSKRIGPRR
jgi:transposase